MAINAVIKMVCTATSIVLFRVLFPPFLYWISQNSLYWYTPVFVQLVNIKYYYDE